MDDMNDVDGFKVQTIESRDPILKQSGKRQPNMGPSTICNFVVITFVLSKSFTDLHQQTTRLLTKVREKECLLQTTNHFQDLGPSK